MRRKSRKLTPEHRAKISVTIRQQRIISQNALKPVPARLRPDQIEDLNLVIGINGEKSIAIRTAVDLLLQTLKVKEYTPEQTAAITQYQEITPKFTPGTTFIFNPQTLGGIFYHEGSPTIIATPEQLAIAWDKVKPKKVKRNNPLA